MKTVMILLVCTILCLSNALPLPEHMIDLTYVYDETTLRFPIFKRFKIGALVNGTQEDRNGQWLQYEEFSSGTHVGTHIDSPAHFIRGGATVDQIPVSNLIAPVSVIDITDRVVLDLNSQATVEDLQNWESNSGLSLNGSIVMLRTGWGSRWGDQAQFYGTTADSDVSKLRFPGMSKEACKWLAEERSIVGVATETLSIDVAPIKGSPCHVILLGKGLYILENVANVDELPIFGAKLYVFPMKIGKGSGSPTRIVAAIPKDPAYLSTPRSHQEF